MKTYSIIALAVVSIVLAVVLITTKNSDNAQMTAVANAIVDYSNRLDTAEMHVSERNGALIILSNTLAETTQTLSNQLTAAQATVAQVQITSTPICVPSTATKHAPQVGITWFFPT